MGMAASQARYLALVARKSNCEYEGQQINQARTALSNQSANLFNQMLGLSVPVPPSTQDYTKTQYSYTDGLNSSTIDSWQQLATPEEEYNYVVTHHYYTDVYTGSQKKMSDPQVQYSTGTSIDATAMSAALKDLTKNRAEYDKVIEEYTRIQENYNKAVEENKAAEEAYNVAVKLKEDAQTARNTAFEAYNTAKATTADFIKSGSNYANLKTSMETTKTALDTAVTDSKDLSKYQNETWDIAAGDDKTLTDGVFTLGLDDFVPYNQLTAADLEGKNITLDDITNAINGLKDIGALPADFDINDTYITLKDSTPSLAFKSDLESAYIATTDTTVPKYDIDPSLNTSISKKLEANKTNIETCTNAYNEAVYKFDIVDAQYKELLAKEQKAKIEYDNAELVLKEADIALVNATANKLTAQTNLSEKTAAKEEADELYGQTISDYETSKTQYYKEYERPEYIGNCEVTLLETLDDDQMAEIKQIIKDMVANDIDANINSCIDEFGNYLGGIYSFKMNGVVYYTTFEDLNNSYTSGSGPNQIDGQIKMSYHNATYVSTKIEETEKALLETDGNGRFSSVRFESDSMTYTLTTETITDDVAYQDAMNQYYYENAKYDKMVQDINAKTSLIQQEDQQLELRLKQLDTEQNALSTEIEAVSKIVKDNIESSFKTFNG